MWCFLRELNPSALENFCLVVREGRQLQINKAHKN
jgi:hypothetical protein